MTVNIEISIAKRSSCKLYGKQGPGVQWPSTSSLMTTNWNFRTQLDCVMLMSWQTKGILKKESLVGQALNLRSFPLAAANAFTNT